MTTATVPPPKTRMTADEFYDFVGRPENAERQWELVRGEAVEMPSPTKIHGVVCKTISRILDEYAERVGRGYVTGNDSGTLLERDPDTVRGPDVAFFLDADSFDDLHPKWGEEPPVFVVEVMSPNDRMSDVNDKIADYLDNGVRLVWLVDPELRKVSVYRPDRSLKVFGEAASLTGGDEMPGLECRVADFFVLRRPKPSAA